MGRVRRYKKIKAIDPFSKARPKAVDTIHDEPPEIFEEASRKAELRLLRRFEDVNSVERMLQREAKRQLQLESSENSFSKKPSLEGRKEDESMKEFKARIREDTRAALRNGVRKITATAKKKKEYLTDRKYKKKGMTRINLNEELIEEGFSSRDDGLLRSSDVGGADEFDAPEKVAFGERMDRPPEFANVAPLRLKQGNSYVEKPVPGSKKRQNTENQTRLKNSWAAANPQQASRYVAALGTADDFEDDSRASKKEKKTKISDIVGRSEMDDCVDARRMQGGMTYSEGKQARATKSPAELARLREQAQKAYKVLRDKKRKF